MKVHLEHVRATEDAPLVARRFAGKRFDHPFHQHPEVELTWISEGAGTLLVGDHVGFFETGDLCLIGENMPHLFQHRERPGSRAISEVLHFRREPDLAWMETFADFSWSCDLFDAARFGLRFDAATGRRVGRLLRNLRTARGVRRWIFFFTILETLSGAPVPQRLASPGYTETPVGEMSDRMRAVCRHILEHYDEPISHTEMAARVGITPAYFSRLFKKTTRRTFTAFVNEVRLGHASRLLVESDWRIVEIAFACGFQSLAHFNRQFKRAYRRSPREYRRLHPSLP